MTQADIQRLQDNVYLAERDLSQAAQPRRRARDAAAGRARRSARRSHLSEGQAAQGAHAGSRSEYAGRARSHRGPPLATRAASREPGLLVILVRHRRRGGCARTATRQPAPCRPRQPRRRRSNARRSTRTTAPAAPSRFLSARKSMCGCRTPELGHRAGRGSLRGNDARGCRCEQPGGDSGRVGDARRRHAGRAGDAHQPHGASMTVSFDQVTVNGRAIRSAAL